MCVCNPITIRKHYILAFIISTGKSVIKPQWHGHLSRYKVYMRCGQTVNNPLTLLTFHFSSLFWPCFVNLSRWATFHEDMKFQLALWGCFFSLTEVTWVGEDVHQACQPLAAEAYNLAHSLSCWRSKQYLNILGNVLIQVLAKSCMKRSILLSCLSVKHEAAANSWLA